MDKIKVLVYTAQLEGGGAEKHLVRILNHFDLGQFDIRIVTNTIKGSYEEEFVHPFDVKRYGLKMLFRVSATLGRLSTFWGLKKEIKRWQPDILFSVQDIQNAIAILAWKQLSKPCKLVLSVQNSVIDRYLNADKTADKWVVNMINEYYHEADSVVALSEGVKDGLIQMNKAIAHNATVIYNAGFDDKVLSEIAKHATNKIDNNRFTLVSCGRLTKQKGYKYLLAAMMILCKKHDLELWILGKGELEDELRKICELGGIQGNVKFLGFQKDPYAFFTKGDLFVLSSEFEGFGNVLVEAMISGLPVISADCPHGPREILESGKYGILIPPKNVDALADAIDSIIGNSVKLKEYSELGKKRAIEFHAFNIALQYQELFKKVSGKG